MPWIEGDLLQQLAVFRRYFASVIVHYDDAFPQIAHCFSATPQIPP